MKKNDVITLKIDRMSSEGSGVGRADDGAVVFVPNTAPGDTAEVKIVKVLKSYSFGRLEKLLIPSEDRISSDCPVFEKCGGCAYRHISYAAETEIKAQQVFHNLKAIGKADFLEEKILCEFENSQRYRNKAQYPASTDENGKIVFGFFAPHSHRIIPVDDCRLQPKIFALIIEEIRLFADKNNISAYDEETGKGVLRHVYLRQAAVSGEIMVCFVVNGKTFTGVKELSELLANKFSQIKSVVLNQNCMKNNVILGDKCVTVFGSDTINDIMCELDVKLSPLSFYQVNHLMAEKVYRLACELAELSGKETVLDLYCGAGLIGLSLAKYAGRVVGIEIVRDAVKDAVQNAGNNGIKNAEFFCGDAALVKKLIDEKKYKFDVAIVDPPRKGCDAAVIEALSSCGAEKIVMISCNSATLARDVSLLCQRGYRAVKVIPADLFPRTVHCETVVLMSRSNFGNYTKSFKSS